MSIKTKLNNVLNSNSFLRLILFLCILLVCCGSFILLYNLTANIFNPNSNSITLITKSNRDTIALTNKYNQLKFKLLYLDTQNKADAIDLYNNIDTQVADYRNDFQILSLYLESQSFYERPYQTTLLAYLAQLEKDPMLTQQNYKIILTYIYYKDIKTKLFAEITENVPVTNDTEDLLAARRIISGYLSELNSIKSNFNLINYSEAYASLYTSVDKDLDILISYLENTYNKYGLLSTALNKNVNIDIDSIIIELNTLNSVYLAQANLSSANIASLWEEIKNNNETFNLETLKIKNRLDEIYEALVKKYNLN